MIFNSTILNPHALFGLQGLDKWSHSLFWGLFFNLFFYVGLSILTKQTPEEERQALIFVESYAPQALPGRADYSLQEIEAVLEQYLGRRDAAEIVDGFLFRNQVQRENLSPLDLSRLRDEAMRILSGSLGSAIATIILEDKLLITEKERGDLSLSIKQMTDYTQALAAGASGSQPESGISQGVQRKYHRERSGRHCNDRCGKACDLLEQGNGGDYQHQKG